MTTSNGPSRRTLVKGAAWSVPVVAVAGAAPALAASPPIVVTPLPGQACKYGGASCGPYFQAYRFTFCFTNTSEAAITVSLTNMRFDDGRVSVPTPGTVTIPAGTENQCFYVVADNMGNSSNGQGFLDYSYTYGGQPVTGTIATGANELPPCENCAPAGPLSQGLEMGPETTDVAPPAVENNTHEPTTDSEATTAAP